MLKMELKPRPCLKSSDLKASKPEPGEKKQGPRAKLKLGSSNHRAGRNPRHLPILPCSLALLPWPSLTKAWKSFSSKTASL